MKRKILAVGMILLIGLCVLPLVSSFVSYHSAYAPNTLPLYTTALNNLNELQAEVHVLLEGVEDTSAYNEQFEAIQEKVMEASKGANYIHKKDLLLEATKILEDIKSSLE
ncbi:MAG: hypothetical protein ACXQTP_07180 [Candidatus Methanofastidiosia archaeon]